MFVRGNQLCNGKGILSVILEIRFTIRGFNLNNLLCKVFGRHVASGSLISGAYKSQHGNQKELEIVSQRVSQIKLC